MARTETRIEKLRGYLPRGWTVRTWSPGDGVTRYRFFEDAPKNQTYFGPDNGRYTALGYKDAVIYALGLGISTHESRSRAPLPAALRRGFEEYRRGKRTK